MLFWLGTGNSPEPLERLALRELGRTLEPDKFQVLTKRRGSQVSEDGLSLLALRILAEIIEVYDDLQESR